MSEGDDTIRLRDLARGLLRGIPDTLTVQKGLWNMLVLRPGSRASIGLMLEKQAQRYPRRLALLFEDQSWTYAEFNA